MGGVSGSDDRSIRRRVPRTSVSPVVGISRRGRLGEQPPRRAVATAARGTTTPTTFSHSAVTLTIMVIVPRFLLLTASPQNLTASIMPPTPRRLILLGIRDCGSNLEAVTVQACTFRLCIGARYSQPAGVFRTAARQTYRSVPTGRHCPLELLCLVLIASGEGDNPAAKSHGLLSMFQFTLNREADSPRDLPWESTTNSL